jgi:(2Fe-2S) ferredoxin
MTIPFDHHVFVCTNRRPDGHPRGSCAAKGSEALRDALKSAVKEAGVPGVRINGSGCLDFCEHGPVVVDHPRNVWWKGVSTRDVGRLVAGPLAAGTTLPDLEMSEAELRRGTRV